MEISTILALLASLFYGSQVITVEYGLEKFKNTKASSPSFLAALISIIVSAALFWIILITRGTNLQGIKLINLFPFIIAGFLNPAIFRLLYFKGIDKVGAGLSASIVAANPAIAAIIAIPLLGENPTKYTLTGMILIITGGAIIQLLRNTENENVEDIILKRLKNTKKKDLLYPIGATSFLGSSYVIVKYGLNTIPNPIIATTTAQTTALIVFIIIMTFSTNLRPKELKFNTSTLAFILAGVFVALGWISSFTALETGISVKVIPLANIFPLFVVIASYGIAKEYPRSPKIILAILSIIIGSILIQIT